MGKTRNTGNISAENIISVDITNDRIGITSASPTATLDVGGNVNVSGVTTSGSFVKSGGTSSQFLKADGSVDSSTYLTTTGSGSALTGIVTSIVAGTNITISGSTGSVTIDAAGGGGAGGGSGTFDTGITTSIYVSVTSGIGLNESQTNDIFVGPGIGYAFPSTAGKKYVIESIHISNSFSNELYFVGRHDFNGGSNVPLAQRVIVPYQGATEFFINQLLQIHRIF